ncbi:MAG TPA: hypothetical protein VGL88_09120 [Pseudonocardiaceae bacterium]|jgi:hypothetical protein
MPEDHTGQATTPAVSAQAAIARARAQLLTGRGPGATPQEITRHTRARPRPGGHPTAQQRDQVAEHNAPTRSDPAALALHAEDRGNELGTALRALRQPLTPNSLAGTLTLAAAALGALITVETLLRHHRRRPAR